MAQSSHAPSEKGWFTQAWKIYASMSKGRGRLRPTEGRAPVVLATRTPANAPELGCYPFVVTRIAGYSPAAPQAG